MSDDSTSNKRPAEGDTAEISAVEPPPNPIPEEYNIEGGETVESQMLPSLPHPGAHLEAPEPSPAAAPMKPAKMARTEKPYKGLRHFSMMVCKKVEEKGTTSYNEVADELVSSVIEERMKEDPLGKFDEKNIRRRVYDALNVLMAMDIISKDKKEISWKGLPTSASQDLDMLERELNFRKQEVDRKRETLRELIVQQVCFRNLIDFNQRRESESTEQQGEGQPPVQGSVDNKIPLPFIVVNTHTSAVIHCNMSRDKTDVMFDFSMPFEINDDNTILKRLKMQRTSREAIREMLPDDLMEYCEQHDLLNQILGDDQPSTSAAATGDYQPPYNAAAGIP